MWFKAKHLIVCFLSICLGSSVQLIIGLGGFPTSIFTGFLNVWEGVGERQPSRESKMKITDFWVSKSTDVNKLNISNSWEDSSKTQLPLPIGIIYEGNFKLLSVLTTSNLLVAWSPALSSWVKISFIHEEINWIYSCIDMDGLAVPMFA